MYVYIITSLPIKNKNMRIENTIPVLNANIDYSLEERYLRAWGSWYAMENRIDDLGYPKSAAFTKERVDGGRGGYFHGDEDINSIPRKIELGRRKKNYLKIENCLLT